MRTQKYGASIRKLVQKSLDAKDSRYECPRCRKLKVKRKCNAIWVCRSCGSQFAGGAYSLTTEAGLISLRNMQEYSSS